MVVSEISYRQKCESEPSSETNPGTQMYLGLTVYLLPNKRRQMLLKIDNREDHMAISFYNYSKLFGYRVEYKNAVSMYNLCQPFSSKQVNSGLRAGASNIHRAKPARQRVSIRPLVMRLEHGKITKKTLTAIFK